MELARAASFLSSTGISLDDDNVVQAIYDAVSDLLFGAFCVLVQRAKAVCGREMLASATKPCYELKSIAGKKANQFNVYRASA